MSPRRRRTVAANNATVANTVGDGLSIIIITLNEASYLPALLECIKAQAAEVKSLEVLVVDGGSVDGTVAVVESYSKSLDIRILQANRGVGSQRNAGARAAKYGALLFLDADIILQGGTLARVAVMPTEQPFVAGIRHTALQMSPLDHVLLAIANGLILLAWLAHRPALNGDFILTTRRTHFDIVGGFVEGSLLGEDTHYGLQAHTRGARYKLLWSPAAYADPRRVVKEGRVRLLRLWSRAYLRNAIGRGPTFPDSGVRYEFGHYPLRSPGTESEE